MDTNDADTSVDLLSTGRTQVAGLLRRMDEEMRTSLRINGYIDQLQCLVSKRDESDLKVLAEKLAAVGRSDDLPSCERDLFFFEMLLEKLTHFESAQKLFFYFLSRILHVFETKIIPKNLNLSREDVEKIINDEIIKPTLAELDEVGGHEAILLTPSEIKGMINFLAERCHIRWQSC